MARKREMKKLAVLMVVLIAVMLLASCNGASDADGVHENVGAQVVEPEPTPEPEPESEPPEHPLVGEWGSPEWYAFRYVFRANGRGSRHAIPGSGWTVRAETFTWRTEGDNTLGILVAGQQREELWAFEIDGDMLNIAGRNLIGRYSYIRVVNGIVGPPIPVSYEHSLIGTWASDEDETSHYVFRADGVGVRAPNQIFHWRTEGEDLLKIRRPIEEESWTFAIEDNMLTIVSRQHQGLYYNFRFIDENLE